MGPGAKHRQEGCRESGVGGGDGVSGMGLRRCGTGTRRGLRAGRDLGRPELGRGYRLPMRETPGSGVSARECRGVEDWAAGIGDPGSGNSAQAATCGQKRPSTTPTPVPYRSAGFKAGMAPLRSVTGSAAAWGKAIPGPKPATPGPTRARSTSGFLHLCLRLLRHPAPSPARVTAWARTRLPAQGLTGLVVRGCPALPAARRGKLTTTPRGQHGRSSGHLSSQDNPGPPAEAAGSAGRLRL